MLHQQDGPRRLVRSRRGVLSVMSVVIAAFAPVVLTGTDSAVAASATAPSVTARPATAAQLQTVMTRIPSAEPFRSVVGGNLSTWGIDAADHRVDVGVLEDTPAIRRAAQQTFGDLVRVSRVDRVHAVRGRRNDSSPFTGAGRLVSGSTSCTGAWTLKTNAGTGYMVTAGHCFAGGSSIYVDGGAYHKVGNIYYRDFHSGGIDVELIGRSHYSDRVWGGSLAAPVAKPVTGHNHVRVHGSAMCIDGAFTGEDCATSVTKTDICANIAYEGFVQQSCHLDVAVSKANRVIATYGDSGGPVYRNDGHGGVTAYGIITAEASNGRAAFYTRLDPILSQYRAHLRTR